MGPDRGLDARAPFASEPARAHARCAPRETSRTAIGSQRCRTVVAIRDLDSFAARAREHQAGQRSQAAPQSNIAPTERSQMRSRHDRQPHCGSGLRPGLVSGEVERAVAVARSARASAVIVSNSSATAGRRELRPGWRGSASTPATAAKARKPVPTPTLGPWTGLRRQRRGSPGASSVYAGEPVVRGHRRRGRCAARPGLPGVIGSGLQIVFAHQSALTAVLPRRTRFWLAPAFGRGEASRRA